MCLYGIAFDFVFGKICPAFSFSLTFVYSLVRSICSSHHQCSKTKQTTFQYPRYRQIPCAPKRLNVRMIRSKCVSVVDSTKSFNSRSLLIYAMHALSLTLFIRCTIYIFIFDWNSVTQHDLAIAIYSIENILYVHVQRLK